MSRSIHANRAASLQAQLDRTETALIAAQDNCSQFMKERDTARSERDAARTAVASLKELLHNAELSAGRLQGQLDRIHHVEEVARTPMVRTVQESTTPHRGEDPHYLHPMGGEAMLGRARDQKHWTSL